MLAPRSVSGELPHDRGYLRIRHVVPVPVGVGDGEAPAGADVGAVDRIGFAGQSAGALIVGGGHGDDDALPACVSNRLDGDTLTICSAGPSSESTRAESKPGEPEPAEKPKPTVKTEPRPTTFDSKKAALIVLKRKK